MYRGIFLTALMLIPSSLPAKQSHYWVLGSYSKIENAHSEKARLSQKLDRTVEIHFEDSLGVYRILTPANETSREDLGTLNAWLLPMETNKSVVLPPPEPEIAQESSMMNQEDPPIVIEEPLTQPLYPEFAAQESLYEYCERLPEARLCQHPRIEKAVEIDRKLTEERDRLKGACSEISHPAWLETCKSLYPE